ncbi:sensor domain-containing protein [Xanthobacter sp. TB0139]|uniref:sensor domain-containing protein n=1 Tax=Xanthobacter sp. TB0139 TaxID=3459178 RepID=UPI004039E716
MSQLLSKLSLRHKSPLRSSALPLAAIVLLGCGIIAIVAYAYISASTSILLDNQRVLSALAEFQAQAITDRVRQRILSTKAVASDPNLQKSLVEWEQTGEENAREAIRTRLSHFQRTFDFADLQLFDDQARRITGVMLQAENPRNLPQFIKKAIKTGRPVMVPAWRAHNGQYLTALVMPLLIQKDDHAPLHAALLTEAALNDTLYTSLARAMRTSRTADLFVMRQEDNDRWIISTPQRDPSLKPLSTHVEHGVYDFAAPADAPEDISLMPALGYDHKGRSVLAVQQDIPGIPGKLIAKVDKNEVLQTTRMVMALSVAIAGLAFLLVLAVGVAIRQSQQSRASQRMLAQANALRRSEARFRATFEQAAVGIAHVSMDHVLLRVNQTLCNMMGYKREEIQGDVCVRYLSPEAAVHVKAARQKVLDGHLPYSILEERYIRKDGSPIWLACTTSLARDENGAPDYFIIVFQDISARRAQEEELRESRERFELAVAGTEEGVWDWDRKTLGLYLSPRCRLLLDLPEDMPLNLFDIWSRLIHPEDKPVFRDAWRRLQAQNSSLFECELRMLKGETEYREVRIRGFGNRDENGRLRRLVGLLADITERKQTERRLRLAAAVFSNSREGIVVTDLEGRISTVNPSFTRITGYDEADVIGRSMRLMHSGRHDRHFYADMWRHLHKKGSWEGEIWNRRKDGVVILEHLSISTAYDENGAPQNFVGAFHDITEIKRSELALDHMAHFDPLTDLPNRTLLASLLDHAVNRNEAQCAVLCVDLDRFKTINESFGHLAGDQVLRTSADRMRNILNSNAVLGRYGADEFLVILEAMKSPDEAGIVAQQIISTLAQPYILGDSQEVYVGASIGISIYPDDAATAQHLIQHANSALSEAKANGRGTYSYYTQGLTQEAKTRVELESDLRRALIRNEFVLHYQPLVELANGKVRGVEALVRWQKPNQGLVMPGHFIPLAEETGLIVPLGDWVMEEACRQMAQWLKDGKVCDYVAVNLSPRQFNRDNLCQWVEKVLENAGLPPQRLEIEITESVLFDSRAEAEKKCESLHAMGVRLALDDFGTGYSSLGYLKRFPITKLKIDHSFVHDLPRSVADSEIADAIIAVARALGLEVVAEGIETEEQYRFLSTHGCDLGQGYLFSRPQPVDILEKLTAEGLPFPKA